MLQEKFAGASAGSTCERRAGLSGENEMEHAVSKPKARRNSCGIAARLPPSAFLLSCSLFWLVLDAATPPGSAAGSVRVGIARTIREVGYYVADAMGFFRDEGLEVSIIGFNSAAQMVAPLGTGELEVGGGTVSAGFYNAVGRGILMKIVADQASLKPG